MKVNVQKIGPCKVKVMVKAEADETRQEYEAVLDWFMKKARVPGFRVGKVPREIIKRDYHKELTEEVQGRLFRALYRKALEQEQIKMVTLLNVGDMLFSPETGILFSMVLDVMPEFDLPKYKKIPVTFEDPVVTEEMLDQQIDHLRDLMVSFSEADAEHALVAGDLACIDFAGVFKDLDVATLPAENQALVKADGFWVRLQDGRFIPELIEALTGMQTGQQREGIKVGFGKEHPVEAFRAQKAVYSLTVKSVKCAIAPSDEELLGRFEMQTLEALREAAREKLLAKQQEREQERREKLVADFLLKKSVFDLPESQVEQAVNQTLDRMMHEVQYQGVPREELEKNRESIIEAATQSANQRLRLRHILGRIAEVENISIDDETLESNLAVLAAQAGMNPAQVRANLEKKERLEDYRAQLCDAATMRFLLDQIKS